MMIVASLIGIVSSIIGLCFSFIYNLPSGATIVIATFSIYILILLFSKIKQSIGVYKQHEKIYSITNCINLSTRSSGSNSSEQHSKGHDKLKVVTTNSIIYDMVKRRLVETRLTFAHCACRTRPA